MTGAIIGGSLIGAAATYYGGQEVSSATEAGTERTAESMDYATDIQMEMYQQTRADQEPWRQAGETALQTIQDMPEFEFTAETFEQFKDPAYQFRLEEGVNALDASAASRGRLLSGAQDKAVTSYGQDLASQEYGNAFNRAQATYQQNLGTQQSLAGIGQSATNLVSQAGQTTASNIAGTQISGTSAMNQLSLSGAQTTADMYSGLANTANVGMGNYLLYQNSLPPVDTTGRVY